MIKICSCCSKYFEKYQKYGCICRPCRNLKQRKYRSRISNRCTKKYEKTLNGFIMRMYRNMKSRITGVQQKKAYLYLGKELLPKHQFYNLVLSSKQFWKLYKGYIESNYQQKLVPTPNRKNSTIGYTLDNIEFITHSENSRLGGLNRFNVHTNLICPPK